MFVIIEIGEQLAWLGSACRVAESTTRQELVRPKVLLKTSENSPQGHAIFDVIFIKTETNETPEDLGQCWRRLFRNICIAEGFPVNIRLGKEQGLEMPFGMMTVLGGADRVTNYAGQLLLKGFETLFVPVQKTSSSVIWHLLTKRNGRRISYNACFQHSIIADRSTDMSCLFKSRHFLGWVSDASQHAGQYCP